MVFALEELGRIGTATGAEAIFAKGCFSSRVAGWSPKTEDRPCFLMACLALWDFVSWSVNPQVVGSSPTRGAKGKTANLTIGSLFLQRPLCCAVWYCFTVFSAKYVAFAWNMCYIEYGRCCNGWDQIDQGGV